MMENFAINKLPLITLIIPAYNTEKYLSRCIDSVISQSYKNLEIILVSDGPIDCHNICDEYVQKDDRIKVIKNIGKGLGGARNVGLDVANGEFIGFIDSDDYIDKYMYEKLLMCMQDEVDLAVCDVNVCGPGLIELRESEQEYLRIKYDGIFEIQKEHIFNTNVSSWNKLYRKNIIDKYNLRFPINMQYEDFPFFFFYILVSSKAYYLNEKLYNYYRHDNAGMAGAYNKDFNKVKDHIIGCDFLFERLMTNGLYYKNKHIFEEIFAEYIQIALNYSKKKDKKKILNLAYKLVKKMKKKDIYMPSLEGLRKKEFEVLLHPTLQRIEILLFGFIPFLTIKKFGDKIKIYLFYKILLLKIKLKNFILN